METSETKIRFSLIIPCHNAAGYITRCFASIAKQEYPLEKVEIVFVDDGSTDGSPAIAERYSQDFPNFKLVANPASSGPGGARNRGLEVATGEYVFYIDVDDYISGNSLKLIDEAISAGNEPDVVLFPYRVDRPASSRRTKGVVKPRARNIQQAAFSPVGPWTHVCKRTLRVPFPENIFSEDTAWHFEQFDKFETVAVVEGDEPCYIYDRTNATAITDTVEWAGDNTFTLEQLAFGDAAVKAGKNDKWISDVIRNFANMYDVRHKITKPWVRQAWMQRFRAEISNLMTGHFVH